MAQHVASNAFYQPLRALVVGLGRAGKRHAHILSQRDVAVITVDPIQQEADFPTLEMAAQAAVAALGDSRPWWDIGVIATPPSTHAQLANAIADQVDTLVIEKPLCGPNQKLEDVLPILKRPRTYVFWNYHFHPVLQEMRKRIFNTDGHWMLLSVQHRPALPEWGLILDHLSHSFDIMEWLLGTLSVESAGCERFEGPSGLTVAFASGYHESGTFALRDYVTDSPTQRIVEIISEEQSWEVPLDMTMHERAWEAILSDQVPDELLPSRAWKIQGYLNDAVALAALRNSSG